MTKLTDDQIMAVWHTVLPREDQTNAMTYRDGNVDRPRVELWRLVERAMEVGIARKEKAAATNSPLLMTNSELNDAIFNASSMANMSTELGKIWARHLLDLLLVQLDRARVGI